MEALAGRAGFVGLGTMGAPMARRLLAAGLDLAVHNRTRDRELPLAALGARRAESPRAAALGAEVLFVCVSDTPDVEGVLLHPGHGALAGLARGAIVVDLSTIAPGATRELAARARAQGVGYVDAPVSGGPEGAREGRLAIMCGGTEADVSRVRPILQHLGRSVVRVGEVGAGQIAKAVNQVAIAGTYMALAEGLVLARILGADPARVVEAIAGGAARSWVLENRAAHMLEDRYPLGFRLALHQKDLGIAAREAREAGFPTPLTDLVLAREDRLLREGRGDEDVSALARLARADASLPEGPL
jgi:3-hydroxyisobutyrate dehydrogenase